MRATLVLCDYAAQDIPGGKVHLMGAGWSVTGPLPTSHAVAVFVKVAWDEANTPHSLALRLLDSDGNVVKVAGPAGEQAIDFPCNLEVPRPAGIPHGSEIDATFVVNVRDLPLKPGERYRWALEVSGDPVASEPFLMRAVPAIPTTSQPPDS